MVAEVNARAGRLVDDDIEVTIRPYGPSAEAVAAFGAAVRQNGSLRPRFAGGKARLLSVRELEGDDSDRNRARPLTPNRYRATIWDAAHGVTVHADGDLDDPAHLEITESATVPPPSAEEFADAVQLVTRHGELGRAVRSGERAVYQPIPAVHAEALPDGRIERKVAVGLLPRAGGSHEIVAVDLGRRSVERFEGGRPANSSPPTTTLCGVPADAGQESASQGTPGAVRVTVKKAGKEIWRFIAVRPAASSGTNGSGIELRFVYYQGTRVFYRAHVPILNVKYDHDHCGPYRDWQYQEGKIRATGADVGSTGFRLCPTPAQTIMDTGSDHGNFLGVGVYLQDGVLVLISELEAGWYRYVSQWRFDMKGVIQPRFGFAAVESECVCNIHHHHAYWRFDFSLDGAAHNKVREHNDPPVSGQSTWNDIRFETRRRRAPAHQRRWRVLNTRSKQGYDILPGEHDGVAATEPDAPFGRGDLWVLRYHPNQIDDGVVATGPPYEAGLNQWLNGEPVDDDDIVVWYGAHFTHDVHESGPAEHGHVVGPELRPVRW